jgi:O-antigen ligase
VGYNGPILKDVDYNPLDFKGITNHPMWLAPISGISTICCLFYYLYSNNHRIKAINLILLITSIFTSIAAASRSSLLAVVISVTYLIYIKSNSIKKFITTILLGTILLMISISYNMVDTRRIVSKNNYQKELKTHSREAIWDKRYKEISDSPLWGIGFGAQGIGYDKKITRTESGGGWIALLSQTGIIGLTLALIILKRAFWNIKHQKYFKGIILNTCILIYLSIHSFFEGYINTPGYNLCILFWLIVGFLTESKIHFEYQLKRFKHK